MKNPLFLKDEARDDAYVYFDKEIRNLPKDPSGKIDSTAHGLEDNDVDAFRHAYVSGVFTQEYGETAADLLGRLNELNPIGQSQAGDDASLNMDLWNNAIGRKYGIKTKDTESLLKIIHKAMKEGELILSPTDKRRFEGVAQNSVSRSNPIIVLREEHKGRNELFFDTKKGIVMNVVDFVSQIEAGQYPGYTVKTIQGKLTPVSKPDSREPNNLG